MAEMLKLSLYLTKLDAMKNYGGVGVQLQAFLTSALDRGEWSISRPVTLIQRKISPVPIAQKVDWNSRPAWTLW
jgi:hypothetical protein